MTYVLMGNIIDCRYYVQDYKGKWQMNGLIDNAQIFPTIEKAYFAIKRIKEHSDIKLKLMPLEITPKL
jgi:hypothetical protein